MGKCKTCDYVGNLLVDGQCCTCKIDVPLEKMRRDLNTPPKTGTNKPTDFVNIGKGDVNKPPTAVVGKLSTTKPSTKDVQSTGCDMGMIKIPNIPKNRWVKLEYFVYKEDNGSIHIKTFSNTPTDKVCGKCEGEYETSNQTTANIKRLGVGDENTTANLV